MATPAYDRTSRAASRTSDIGAQPTGWADRIRRLVLDVRLVAHDHVELLVLEAQRASQVLVRTIAAAIVISVLVATAWLGLIVAVVVWLAEHMPLPASLLIGAAGCLAVAGGIGWWVAKHVPEMMFAATLRQLKATASAEGEAVDDDEPEADATKVKDAPR